MSIRLLRAKQVYGVGGRIPVSKGYFFDNYVLRDDGDQFVPHTNGQVRRLKPVHLGVQALAFIEDEIDELNAALVALRDQQLKGQDAA